MSEEDDSGGDPSASRRELLAFAGGAGLGLGTVRAVDNVLIGYGRITGTNLHEQDLEEWAIEGFEPNPVELSAGPGSVQADGQELTVESETTTESVNLARITAEEAAALDEEHGLDGAPITELSADLPALERGDVEFRFSTIDRFFERAAAAESRPFTTGTVRGSMDADPTFVEAFTGVNPTDPEPLVEGLADAFREHSYYDIPRYAAGSIEDNVLLGRVDLREHFESPTDFEALAAGENDGLFCTELTLRGIDAFHAVQPLRQDPPICCAYVRNSRHKHAYLGLASVVRSDGDLVVLMTFVDYTYALLYDDLRIRRIVGDGVEAYDTRHRATEIVWNV